jgi:hypothetical protein
MNKLYIWNSDVLCDWTSGAAVAAASSEEQARSRILAAWDADNAANPSPFLAERTRLAAGIAGPADSVLPLELGVYFYGGA